MNNPVIHDETTPVDTSAQFRSQVGHISRNSSVYFAGTIFSTGLGYLFKVYVARVLGAELLGLYALGITLVGFLGIFNTLGLPHAAVRFVASYRASDRFKELHALIWRGGGLLIAANALLAIVLVLAGKVIAIRFYHAPKLVPYLPLFALIMLFAVLSGFYGKVLAGFRDIKLRTWIVSFFGAPFNMLVAVLLISLGMGLRGYLVAQIISAACVSTLLLLAVRRFTPPAARWLAMPGSNPNQEIWSFSSAMLGIALLEFIMSQVDKIALGFYTNARQVGIYSVAAAFVAYVPLVLSSINQIFAPTISDLHTRGQIALLTKLFQSLTKWATGLTLPLAVVVIIFARPLMRIFGPDFAAGWPILAIGTVGQLVNCGVGPVGYLLLMSGHEKRLIKVQAVMALGMVVFSVMLVPYFGIIGAAIAAALTNIGVNLWNLWEVRKALGMSPYNRGYVKLLAPLAAMLIIELILRRFASVFRHDIIAVVVALVLSYLVFAAMTFSFGMDADDRMILSAIRSKLRLSFVATVVPE